MLTCSHSPLALPPTPAVSASITNFLARDAELDRPDLWVEIPDGGMLADVDVGTDEYQMVEVSYKGYLLPVALLHTEGDLRAAMLC